MDKKSIVLSLYVHPILKECQEFLTEIEKELENKEYFYFRRYGKSKIPFTDMFKSSPCGFGEITSSKDFPILRNSGFIRLFYWKNSSGIKILGFYIAIGIYNPDITYWIAEKGNIEFDVHLANFLYLNKTNYPEYK